jgi:hypothetical protein
LSNEYLLSDQLLAADRAVWFYFSPGCDAVAVEHVHFGAGQDDDLLVQAIVLEADGTLGAFLERFERGCHGLWQFCCVLCVKAGDIEAEKHE